MSKRSKPDQTTSSCQTTRRDFVKTSAAIGAGFWVAGGVAPKRTYASKNEEIQFGCIGVGGKGSSDSEDAKRNGQVVAVCDIDETKIDKNKFPDAKVFYDFRELLSEMGDKIDAVTVSTPDHNHAVASLAAMRMGKHCFCQKPLTHSIEEARLMGTVAREKGLMTQMGNQGTAESILRKSAALIKQGVIGPVSHVHVWTNRPVWPQGIDVKIKEAPDPGDPAEVEEWEKARKAVHWKEWIGPAPTRPYSPEIHPFKWRGLWNYGTGALGDMACHTLNMAFMALDLRDPTSVVAKCSEHDKVMYPKWSVIDFEFPERNGRPPLKMTWYDGGKMPPTPLIKELPRNRDGEVYNSGALIVGAEGNLFSPGDYGGDDQGNTGILRPDGTFEKQRRMRDVEFTRAPAGGHFVEFAEGIKGNGTPVSNFPDYSGPLTETILLGNLAVWAGNDQLINWDAHKMIASNVPSESTASVEQMIRHKYLNGYSIT